jgi:Rap guanine nucleotide exchange factor 2
MDHPQHRGINIMLDQAYAQNMMRPSLYHKCSRGSHSSDTSSAYSGSDTMASNHSELDGDDIDFTGLVESIVDSDEEDDLGESMDSLTVRDRVRDCLERTENRTEDEIEMLLEFIQHLKAFTNMTLAVRRKLCSAMRIVTIDKAGTEVLSDGEELDSWAVVVNGCMEVLVPGEESQTLTVGDGYGVSPVLEKQYHKGVLITKCDDCQFVFILQEDYHRWVSTTSRKVFFLLGSSFSGSCWKARTTFTVKRKTAKS